VIRLIMAVWIAAKCSGKDNNNKKPSTGHAKRPKSTAYLGGDAWNVERIATNNGGSRRSD